MNGRRRLEEFGSVSLPRRGIMQKASALLSAEAFFVNSFLNVGCRAGVSSQPISFAVSGVLDYASYVMHICLDVIFCIVYDAFMLFEIGRYIRQERKKRKLSQATLGKLLGMSRTTIGQIENGTIQDIGIRKLIRILEILDLELRVRIASERPTLDELRDEDDF